jgi:hypothetical protein
MGSYADLVFHVLAHVRPDRPLAPSLYFPGYIECCKQRLGPADARPLGEDLVALGRLVSDHQRLDQALLLAWLFETPEDASVYDAVELDSLPPESPVDPRVLSSLRSLPESAIELLRCSVALERQHWAKLPETRLDPAPALLEKLERMRSVAPHLCEVHIGCVRPLGLRGRAFFSSVLVGTVDDPLEGCSPSAEHAALQAAHEATVIEVRNQANLPFLQLEHTALTVLRLRARETVWEEAHGRWLGHLRLGEFGGLENLKLEALGSAEHAVAVRLLGDRAG